MNELNIAAEWLYERFISNQVLKDFVGRHPVKNVWQFYEEVAYEKARFPYLVFQLYGGRDNVLGAEANKILVPQVYQIKLYIEDYDFSKLKDPSDQIVPLLTWSQMDSPQTELDQWIAGCHEVRPLKSADPIDGVLRIYMGSMIQLVTYAG